MQIIEIYDKNLPGANETLVAKGKRYPYARMKKKYTDMVKYACLDAKIRPIKRVFLSLTWIEPHMKRDLDNIAYFVKYIFDGLVNAKVIKNDGWKNVDGWENIFEIQKGIRGVKITLLEAGE